jgi:hypothetical protein
MILPNHLLSATNLKFAPPPMMKKVEKDIGGVWIVI